MTEHIKVWEKGSHLDLFDKLKLWSVHSGFGNLQAYLLLKVRLQQLSSYVVRQGAPPSPPHKSSEPQASPTKPSCLPRCWVIFVLVYNKAGIDGQPVNKYV